MEKTGEVKPGVTPLGNLEKTDKQLTEQQLNEDLTKQASSHATEKLREDDQK